MDKITGRYLLLKFDCWPGENCVISLVLNSQPNGIVSYEGMNRHKNKFTYIVIDFGRKFTYVHGETLNFKYMCSNIESITKDVYKKISNDILSTLGKCNAYYYGDFQRIGNPKNTNIKEVKLVIIGGKRQWKKKHDISENNLKDLEFAIDKYKYCKEKLIWMYVNGGDSPENFIRKNSIEGVKIEGQNIGDCIVSFLRLSREMEDEEIVIFVLKKSEYKTCVYNMIQGIKWGSISYGGITLKISKKFGILVIADFKPDSIASDIFDFRDVIFG